MENSYIKLYRGLLDWEWFSDSKTLHLFIYILLKANFVNGKWKGVDVKRGQLITGRKKLSLATGISEMSIRTCLDKLCKTNEITIKSTNDFSIITIVKYDVYQCFEKKSTSKLTSELTNKKPATNQQLTTIEEGNKEEKEIYFDTFWSFYPNKVAKEKCKAKFLKLEPDEITQILATIQNWAKYKPFESYSHPNPETYLNQKRWQDVIPEVKKVYVDLSGQS